jgi:hypothetical protein
MKGQTYIVRFYAKGDTRPFHETLGFGSSPTQAVRNLSRGDGYYRRLLGRRVKSVAVPYNEVDS